MVDPPTRQPGVRLLPFISIPSALEEEQEPFEMSLERATDRGDRGGPRARRAAVGHSLRARRSFSAAVALLLAVVAVCGPAPTSAADWPLEAYAGCGGQPLGVPPPAGPSGVDMSYDVDAGVLWVASGLDLYRTSFPGGEVLAAKSYGSVGGVSMLAVESITVTARKELENLTTTSAPHTLSVAHIGEGKAAVVDGTTPMVSIVDGDLNTVDTILLEIVPYSITYDAAYEVFYATLATDRNTVVQFDLDGVFRVLFNGDDIADVIADSEISDIYYASNLGTLMLLCEGCETITEVSLAGSILKNEVKASDVQAIAFARTGSPMLQLNAASMNITQMCQDIPLATPVLPPLSGEVPPPQSWFPLDTYAFCGERILQVAEGAVLQDFAVGPMTRTLWAVVDGDLVEYSLGGDILRVQTKDMLANIGIEGPTGVAWKERYTLLLASQEGNMVAVVNTVPQAVLDAVPYVYAAETGLTGDDLEPPGPEEEMDIVRRINQLDVLSTASVGAGLIAPNSLQAVTYNSEAGTVLCTSANSTAIVSSPLDGSEPVLLIAGDVLGETATEISNLLYNAEKEDVLVWCEECASLTEAMATPETFLSARKFVPFESDDFEDRAGSYTISPEGALLMIGSNNGEISYYCSNGEPIGQSPLITVVRENTQPDVGPEYWWNLQTTTGNSAANDVPAPIDNDVRTANAEPYEYFEQNSCRDTSLVVILDSTVGACEQYCSTNPSCNAYTYNTNTLKCFPKATCDDLQDHPIDFTGIKTSPAPTAAPTPAPTKPPVTFTMLVDVGCKDPTLRFFAGLTAQQCQNRCKWDWECKAYTYNVAGQCFLKKTCDQQQDTVGDIAGLKVIGSPPTAAPTPAPAESESESSEPKSEDSSAKSEGESSQGLPEGPSDPALYGGWEFNGQDCSPWDLPDNNCGLSANPGLKVGDITWYRMFAHKSNPLIDRGDGVVEWTPFRERTTWGEMYWKGSEIMGYFDEPMSAKNVGDVVSVAFAWNSVGSTECKGSGEMTEKECEECEEDWDGSSKYIYHEVRCYSGTGDFRVALVDSTKGDQVEKDGYGYWNKNIQKYRGLQWRFHPHACPTEPRAKPGGYAATAAGSWIRSNIKLDEANSQGQVLDFIENSELGDRPFKERLFDPQDDGACINLPVGEWTPESDPFRMTLRVRERSGGKVRFEWGMSFNGWSGEKTEEWDEDLFPNTIDTVVFGYTNSRSFTSLKLKRV